MTARIVTGSKQQIAVPVASLEGEVREAIVFVEETTPDSGSSSGQSIEEMFKEMEPYVVNVGQVDYSRDSIYDASTA